MKCVTVYFGGVNDIKPYKNFRSGFGDRFMSRDILKNILDRTRQKNEIFWVWGHLE